jgi:hypothetical protein
MILGYSGPATSRAIHLFDRPNYDLDSSFVTPVVVRSTSKYSLSIGYRAHSSLLDCARWPNSAINCVTNAPLSRAEVFTVLLIDYEAWVCDLNPRDINGLPGALSFILCGQTVFSLAVNPGQTGATGPCRCVQFLGATSLSVERQPMGTSLTCRPRDNRIAGNYCRLSGLNIEGLISAKEIRNSTRRTWKVCLLIFKVFSWLRILRYGSQG